MATVRGIYFGLTEAELLRIREQILSRLEAIRTGADFTSGGGVGGSWTKNHTDREDLVADMAEVTAALKRINPNAYGRRVKKLLANFTGGEV